MVQTVYFEKNQKKEKNKFSNRKTENQKIQKIQKIWISVIYVCVCKKAKKWVKLIILCRYNGIKYKKIRFKPIFSPVERILYV